MKIKSKKYLYLLFTLLIGFTALLIYFQNKENSWKVVIKNASTSSSCRAADLNQDGILDIVVGAGAEENKSTDHGIIAINGKNGDILWTVPCRNQVVGSAIFYDVTNDGIEDVFIGGRSAQLWCIDGASGNIIWEYLKTYEGIDLKDEKLLNFFNPQFIEDQDQDGYKDILISFGGYVPAPPGQHDRPFGSLFILSAKTGKILVQASMPDGKETYFSPVVYDFKKDGNPYVIFGSGGETVNGGLYAIRLNTLMNGNLESATKISDGQGFGFIATPVIIDITGDKVADIVINAFNGRMIAFDGNTFEQIWSNKVGYKVATFSSPAPVDINNDGVMDFFGSFGEGIWNDFQSSVQVVIDGKTGKELLRYKNKCNFLYSSPVVGDFTKDGKEDILLSTNITIESHVEKTLEGELKRFNKYTTELSVFDLYNNKTFLLGQDEPGTNLCSTPLMIDLDNNGKLDIIHCKNSGDDDIFSAKALIIERKEIPLNLPKITWGAFMGSNYDCIY